MNKVKPFTGPITSTEAKDIVKIIQNIIGPFQAPTRRGAMKRRRKVSWRRATKASKYSKAVKAKKKVRRKMAQASRRTNRQRGA